MTHNTRIKYNAHKSKGTIKDDLSVDIGRLTSSDFVLNGWFKVSTLNSLAVIRLEYCLRIRKVKGRTSSPTDRHKLIAGVRRIKVYLKTTNGVDKSTVIVDTMFAFLLCSDFAILQKAGTIFHRYVQEVLNELEWNIGLVDVITLFPREHARMVHYDRAYQHYDSSIV